MVQLSKSVCMLEREEEMGEVVGYGSFTKAADVSGRKGDLNLLQ